MALKTQATKQEKADQIYYAFRGFFPGLKEETGGLEEALGGYAALCPLLRRFQPSAWRNR